MKTGLHHWWPRSLSGAWSDSAGLVHRLTPDGKVVSAPPKNWGAITNAHRIKLDGPWDTDFEPSFSEVDNTFQGVIETFDVHFEKEGRARRVHVAERKRREVGAAMAALLVRSPGFKWRVEEEVSRNWPTADKTLIAANIHNSMGHIQESLEGASLLIAFRCLEGELVMGDGYLSNLRGGDVDLPFLRLLVPLTPTLAVAACNRPGLPRDLKGVWHIPIGHAGVSEINDVTQTYSGNFLFFKSVRPKVTPEFKSGVFGQLPDHRFERLESAVEKIHGSGKCVGKPWRPKARPGKVLTSGIVVGTFTHDGP